MLNQRGRANTAIVQRYTTTTKYAGNGPVNDGGSPPEGVPEKPQGGGTKEIRHKQRVTKAMGLTKGGPVAHSGEVEGECFFFEFF